VGVVDTLDSNKFAEKKQQRFRIGDQQFFQPHVLLLNQSKPFKVSRIYYDQCMLYPPDTDAFLYYSMLPERPPIAGELRLRVTSSDDPASFGSGSDLLRADGLPWSRPLLTLKYYFPLYEKLREEGFVSDHLDAALSTLPYLKFSYRRSHYLYTLNDTFIVDFSSLWTFFFVITEQGTESISFTDMFLDVREMCKYATYTGADTNHHISILLY
jgi:hypothetical protein